MSSSFKVPRQVPLALTTKVSSRKPGGGVAFAEHGQAAVFAADFVGEGQ